MDAKLEKLKKLIEDEINVCKKDIEDADVRYAGFLHGMVNGYNVVLGRIKKIGEQ